VKFVKIQLDDGVWELVLEYYLAANSYIHRLAHWLLHRLDICFSVAISSMLLRLQRLCQHSSKRGPDPADLRQQHGQWKISRLTLGSPLTCAKNMVSGKPLCR